MFDTHENLKQSNDIPIISSRRYRPGYRGKLLVGKKSCARGGAGSGTSRAELERVGPESAQGRCWNTSFGELGTCRGAVDPFKFGAAGLLLPLGLGLEVEATLSVGYRLMPVTETLLSPHASSCYHICFALFA